MVKVEMNSLKENALDYIGLYYPHINFQNDAWIKLAALYWDKIGRIVPPSYATQDSITVQYLIDELGFIKNFAPSKTEMEEVSDLFVTVLTSHLSDIQKFYSLPPPRWSKQSNTLSYLMLDGPWPINLTLEQRRLSKYDPRLAYLLQDGKIALELGELLRDCGLAYPCHNLPNFPTVIAMHPKLAFIYMEVLAEEMATRRQFYPVADEELNHIATSGYTLERLIQALLPPDRSRRHLIEQLPTEHEVEIQMATIALKSVLPKNIASIPVQKIIKLRHQYREEMTTFQRAIHETVLSLGQLQRISDLTALQAHLEVAYETRLKPHLNDLSKYMNSLGIQTAASAMNIRLSDLPLLTSTGQYLHLAPINPVIAGAGAIAYSMFPVIQRKREEAQHVVHTSPIAYLLYVKEGLKPANVITQIRRKAREIFFQV